MTRSIVKQKLTTKEAPAITRYLHNASNRNKTNLNQRNLISCVKILLMGSEKHHSATRCDAEA